MVREEMEVLSLGKRILRTDTADNYRDEHADAGNRNERKKSRMEAYLDNSATTRCSESVRDIMLQVMMEDYGNPSSLTSDGKKKSRGLYQRKQEKNRKTLKVTEKEIILLPEVQNRII